MVNGFIGQWPAELGERPAHVDPGQLGLRGPPRGQRGCQDGQRQPFVGHLTGAARHPATTQKCLRRAELGLIAVDADQPHRTGRSGSARLGIVAVGAAAVRRQRCVLPRGRGGGRGGRAGRRPAEFGDGRGELVGGRPTEAGGHQGVDRNGRTAGRRRPAAAPVHAVVTTEQQLFQRAAALPDAKNVVSSWLPPGPTAVADYPTVLLAGNWLSQEQVAAASEFARFMRKPEQLAELAKAGFRTEGGTPPQSDVTSFAPLSAPLSVGDSAMRATLANTLTAPVGESRGDHHAGPVDAGRRGRQVAAGQRDRRTQRPTAGAAAELRRRSLDVRRCRGPIRGVDGPAVRSGRRQTSVGGADRRTGRADRVGRRGRLVHHAAVDLRPGQGELPSGPEQFDPRHHHRAAHGPVAGRRRARSSTSAARSTPPARSR